MPTSCACVAGRHIGLPLKRWPAPNPVAVRNQLLHCDAIGRTSDTSNLAASMNIMYTYLCRESSRCCSWAVISRSSKLATVSVLYSPSCGRSEAPGCACVAISQSSDKPGFDSGKSIRTRCGYARAPVRMVAKREQMSDPTEKNDLTDQTDELTDESVAPVEPVTAEADPPTSR